MYSRSQMFWYQSLSRREGLYQIFVKMIPVSIPNFSTNLKKSRKPLGSILIYFLKKASEIRKILKNILLLEMVILMLSTKVPTADQKRLLGIQTRFLELSQKNCTRMQIFVKIGGYCFEISQFKKFVVTLSLSWDFFSKTSY